MRKTGLQVFFAGFMMIALLGSEALHAQSPREKVKALKIAFMTKRLQLTPAEAKEFWPVYDEYEAKIEQLRMESQQRRMAARETFDQLSEKEMEQLQDDMLDARQAELDLMRKYSNEFKKVLPMKKAVRVLYLEQAFRDKVLNHAAGQRPRPGPGPRGRRTAAEVMRKKGCLLGSLFYF